MIFCSNCGEKLTGTQLKPVKEDFHPEWIDDTEIIPQGQFWLVENKFWSSDAEAMGQAIVVNGQDVMCLKPDFTNYSGCCGNSIHVPNQRCESCETLVATRIDDCWTSYYLYFLADRVAVG